MRSLRASAIFVLVEVVADVDDSPLFISSVPELRPHRTPLLPSTQTPHPTLSRPVYWGSLAHQRTYSNKLKVDFINRDGSDVGNAIQAVIEANIKNTTHMKLGWRIETDKYPTDKEAVDGMLREHSWMTVIGELSLFSICKSSWS